MTLRLAARIVLSAAGFAALAWFLSPRAPIDEPPAATAEREPSVDGPSLAARAHAADAAPAQPFQPARVEAPPSAELVPEPASEVALPVASVGADVQPALREPTPVPLSGAPEGVRKLLLWTAADPAAATSWADQRPDPDQRAEALQAVCVKIAESDPRAALDMAERFRLDDDAGLVENLIAQWSAIDPAAALAWAAQRPAGDLRDQLTARVAFVVSASDPAEAARLVEIGITPGAVQADAAAALMQSWASRDAPAAAAWAQSLPASAVQARALRELAAFLPR